MSLNGEPDGEPIKAPTFLADDLAGLHAALSALAALRHRDRTGEGQHIDVALLDAMLFQSTGYLTLGALGVAAAAARQPVPHRGAGQHLPLPRRAASLAGVLLDAHWKRPGAADRPARAGRRRRATRPRCRADRAARRGGRAARATGLARAHRGGGARRRCSAPACPVAPRAQLRRGGAQRARARARHAPADAASRRRQRARSPDRRPSSRARRCACAAAARARRRTPTRSSTSSASPRRGARAAARRRRDLSARGRL